MSLLQKISVVGLLATIPVSGYAYGQSTKASPPQYDNESDYTLRASDILAAATINGPNYQVDPTVKLQDGKFVFRIRTRWGVLTAKGLPFLELRLREMYAIERAERLSDKPQEIHGFLDTLVDTKDGATVLLTEPIGAVLRIPAGIRSSLTSSFHPSNARAGNTVRRKIAAQIGCDPETRNPILKKLLDWMALRKGLGAFAGKLGLNLTLPVLALLPATTEFRAIVAEQLPSDINKSIESKLLAMGMPKDTTKLFCRDHAYTTTQRLMILTELQLLGDDILQLDLLLSRAVATRNESEGLAFIRELTLLRTLHKQQTVDSIVGGISSPMLVVKLERDSHILVTADDYLVLTERLSGFRQAYRKSFDSTPATVYGDARLTARVSEYLRRAAINVPAVASVESD